MELNNQYNIMTACGLMTCHGIKYNDEFAVVHNWKQNVFNMTHIASGTGITQYGYNTLEECLGHAEDDVKRGRDHLEKNPEHKQKLIDTYNYCIKQNIFVD